MGLSFIVSVVSIISLWKVFEKAGEAGWKSLIPFYNVYILYRISGMSGNNVWWLIGLVISVMVMFLTLFGVVFTNLSDGFESLKLISDDMTITFIFLAIITFVLSIVNIILTVRQCIGLAKKFDQEGAFGIGLFLVGVLFYAILAFGTVEYNSSVE